MSIAEWWTMPEQQEQKPDQVSEVTTTQFGSGIRNTVCSELKYIHTVYCMYHADEIMLIHNIYSLIILSPGWRVKTCSLYPTGTLFLGLRPWNHRTKVVDKGNASIRQNSCSPVKTQPFSTVPCTQKLSLWKPADYRAVVSSSLSTGGLSDLWMTCTSQYHPPGSIRSHAVPDRSTNSASGANPTGKEYWHFTHHGAKLLDPVCLNHWDSRNKDISSSLVRAAWCYCCSLSSLKHQEPSQCLHCISCIQALGGVAQRLSNSVPHVPPDWKPPVYYKVC